MSRSFPLFTVSVFAALLYFGIPAALKNAQSGEDPPNNAAASVTPLSLKPFNSLIGSWNGVGQPKRGSSRGAWSESVLCEWNFDDKLASVVLKSRNGKQFQQLKLSWDAEAEVLVLRQQYEGGSREYRGSGTKTLSDRIVLATVPDASGVTYRCTIQQLSEIRSTLLFEKQTSPTGSFRRVAGIGYTRDGAKLAEAGANQRKCIVTGGLGTISVSYKGETFYVCCQGCVQAFNESPEAIIAEYRASLKSTKK